MFTFHNFLRCVRVCVSVYMLFRQFTCGILHSNESKFKLEETNLVLPCIKHTTWTHYRVWKRNRITITTTTVFEALSYKVRCCCYIYAWRRPCQGRRFILSRWCVVVVVLCCVFFLLLFSWFHSFVVPMQSPCLYACCWIGWCLCCDLTVTLKNHNRQCE